MMADTQYKPVTYNIISNKTKKNRFAFAGCLALFQIGFILCFVFFAKFNYEIKSEVTNLYSSKLKLFAIISLLKISINLLVLHSHMLYIRLG